MVAESLIFRRGLPWFGAGTIVGIFGSQLLQDLSVVEKSEPPRQVVLAPEIRSPHYPAGHPLPSTSNVVVRPSFTTSHNYRTKTPDWVAELLTADLVNGKNGERKNAQFKSDSDIPWIFKATNDDYWDSGWSRGHLAASASHRKTQAGQDSTFLLNSNIVPQDLSMNGCDWNRLEVLVRDLTKSHPNGQVYVLSGPAWVPESNTPFTQRPFSKNKVVMHEVVGDNNVYVPTHMFKVIRLDDESEAVSATAAFLMPNRPIAKEANLETYLVDMIELEKLTGLDLSGLKSGTGLCTVEKCNRPTNRRMHGWRHYGYIDEARGIDELRTAVRNAIDDGFVDGDNFLIPKAVRDRMRDLNLGEDVVKLFPGEEKYQKSVLNGFEVFKKRSVKDSE